MSLTTGHTDGGQSGGGLVIRLCESDSTFDGYPVSELVKSCLVDATDYRRELCLINDVLTHWTEILSRDIAQIPATPSEALNAIRARMEATRLALAHARDVLMISQQVLQQGEAEPCDMHH